MATGGGTVELGQRSPSAEQKFIKISSKFLFFSITFFHIEKFT